MKDFKKELKSDIILQEQEFTLSEIDEVENISLDDEFGDESSKNNVLRIKRSLIPTNIETKNPDLKFDLGEFQFIENEILIKKEKPIRAKIIAVMDYKRFIKNQKEKPIIKNFKKSECLKLPITDIGLNEYNQPTYVTYLKKDIDGNFTRDFDESKSKDNEFLIKNSVRVVLEIENKLYNFWFKGVDYSNCFSFINSVYKNTTKVVKTKGDELIPLAKDFSYKNLNFMILWELETITRTFNSTTNYGLNAKNPTLDDETSEMVTRLKNGEITNQDYQKYLNDLKTKINKIKQSL